MNDVLKTTTEEKDKLESLLKKYEISIEKVQSFILPELIDGNPSFENKMRHSGHSSIDFSVENKELFNVHVPEIKKYFALNGFGITVIRDKNKKPAYEVLQDNDIILPVITFLGSTVFTIGLGVLINYISAKLFGSNRVIKVDVIKMEIDNIRLERFQLSGSAEEVVEALKVLKGDLDNEKLQ